MELIFIITACFLLALFFPMWYFGRPSSLTDYRLYRLVVKRKKLKWVEFTDLSESQINWKQKQYNLTNEIKEKVAYILGTEDSQIAFFFDVDQKLLGLGYAYNQNIGGPQFVAAGEGSLLDFSPNYPHND